MSPIDQSNTPEDREQARSRLRALTRGAVFAAAGATVVLGVVVSRDHPGSSTTDKFTGTASTSSGAATTNGASSATSGSSSSGNTGTSSSTPSVSQSTPTVTSGGSSR